MNENNHNQQLLQIIKDNQKSSRLNTIAIAFSTLATAITSGVLIWKSFKKTKPSSKVRLIRKRGRIDKIKLLQKAQMDKELLELEILEREVQHETELRKLETGLEEKETKEVITKTDNFLTNLKNKGEKIISDQTSKLKDKINDK